MLHAKSPIQRTKIVVPGAPAAASFSHTIQIFESEILERPRFCLTPKPNVAPASLMNHKVRPEAMLTIIPQGAIGDGARKN
jgi:hypothetical protein